MGRRPSHGPGRARVRHVNLAYGRKRTAFSTHGSFTACAAVDGDSDYRHWGPGYGWNDADKGSSLTGSWFSGPNRSSWDG